MNRFFFILTSSLSCFVIFGTNQLSAKNKNSKDSQQKVKNEDEAKEKKEKEKESDKEKKWWEKLPQKPITYSK